MKIIIIIIIIIIMMMMMMMMLMMMMMDENEILCIVDTDMIELYLISEGFIYQFFC